MAVSGGIQRPLGGRQRLRAVFFDVGETLIDETRVWEAWADWLGVPRFTLLGLLGATIARGEHHTKALEIVRPGIDLEAERQARAAAGAPDGFVGTDLYSDAVDCLQALRSAGYVVGIAGNMSKTRERSLLEMALPADIVASSETLGAEKPSVAFFSGLCELVAVPRSEAAYVGDRLDNDVLPAASLGMVAIFVRRGPWGHLHAERPDAGRADIRISSLDELPSALSRLR
jgi:HAD superfamily hydrolase (TIGR01549 family)